MRVYTFSSGGCRDGIYLDILSMTVDGVCNLISLYLLDTRDDLEYIDCSIDEVGKWIKVRVLDVVCREYSYLVYSLVSFEVN